MARSAKAMSVELPKWPAMTVMGDRVTSEQAAEIIIRTTAWYHGTNDRAWQEIVWHALGVEVTTVNEWQHAKFEALEAARTRLRGLSLNYLYTSRVMSSWIGGPHGWCNWNGDIHSNNYNIGKWPSVAEVRAEWQAIAEAFPFLRLRCQLWSGETCEDGIQPLIEFSVAQGTVKATTPRKAVLYPRAVGTDDLTDFFRAGRERGCTEEKLRWAIQQTLDNRPRPTTWERLTAEEAP